MPFKDYDPIALPEGFDLNPEEEEVVGDLLGSAFRIGSPIGSAMSAAPRDDQDFDPEYRPWNDIQGTVYEGFSDAFVDARTRADVNRIKSQVDREIEDRKVIDAAGPWGYLAEFGASLLSPTTILPGGAIVRGASGAAKVGKTALNVAGSAGIAAALDEIGLQASQETRSAEETAVTIGGSVILGGLLGTLAGTMSRQSFKATSMAAEALPEQMREFEAHRQSIGAARTQRDLELRREEFFQFVNKIPVFRAAVRSDPVLRGQLSDFQEVRQATADLVDTTLQYRANETGQKATQFDMSAETAILLRRNSELSEAYGTLERLYAEYVHDGQVGVIGRLSAPITGRWGHLAGYDRKLSKDQFFEEVGAAMQSGDTHPFPQVAKAAQELRAKIFDPVGGEAVELGMFDEGLLVNSKNYFSRVYNREMIKAHRGDGSDRDLAKVLNEQFRLKREKAQNTLAFDRSLDEAEGEAFKLREVMRTAQTALDKARKKAVQKMERAKASLDRVGASKSTAQSLKESFSKRRSDLNKSVLTPSETTAWKDTIKAIRANKSREPQDILSAIRKGGGIADDATGELKVALDTKYITIARKDGQQADYVRQNMEDLGFLPEGSTVNDLYDAIRSSANGDKVYSRFDAEEVEMFNLYNVLEQELAAMGIDVSRPIDDILKLIPEKAQNQSRQKGKVSEAGRSAREAFKKQDAAERKLDNAIDRLESAKARIAELDGDVKAKVKSEIEEASKALKELRPELKKAQAARDEAEYYASLDDAEIGRSVDDAIDAILGLKPGEHFFRASLAKPTRARTLDVPDDVIRPWLEMDARIVLGQYFNSMIPDIEITRRFGDVELTRVKERIQDEMQAKLRDAKSARARNAIQEEAKLRGNELQAMADRIRGIYGVPKNPDDVWVRGARSTRTLSYMGFLGGMTLSALPDVAGVIGRNGFEAAFGSIEAVTNPKRFIKSVKDQKDFLGAAEWYLNNRAQSVFELTEPYGRHTRLERGLDATANAFGVATGMIPWNVALKSIGGAFVGSKISKAAVAMAEGKATKRQKLLLGANNIDPAMADRIAAQINKHADKDGLIWLPQARNWDDQSAYKAMGAAMNREMNIMVVTPGQDKPLAWSTEVGKFFSQFKSFALSAHHRITLAGLQRMDGAVASQVALALTLGMLVSRMRADLGGYDQKEGAALWEDAIDRSGLLGWLPEVHGIANVWSGGRLSLSGETPSRFASRSAAAGALGPSVDMLLSFSDAVAAAGRQELTERDASKLLRPVPFNNHPLAQLSGIFDKIEKGLAALDD